MYKKTINSRTGLAVNQSTIGETLETKMQRIIHNGEPIKEGVKMIYTESSEGVKPEHDIRTDRFDIALEGFSKIEKSRIAKAEEKAKILKEKEDTQSSEDSQE